MTSRIRRFGIIMLAAIFAVLLSAFVLSVLPSKSTYADATTVEHTDHTDWTALTSENLSAFSTSGGKYYLGDNLEVTSAIRIGESTATEATLCLNGKRITYTGTSENSVIIVGHLGTFNLCDCSSSATNSYGYGEVTGTLTVSTGLIKGGKGYGTGSERLGGGVYVDGGTFNMYGGAIAGNTATYGGGVYVKHYSDTETGAFNMYGGTITGNTATRGGVYIRSKSALNIYGKVNISDNKTLDKSGNDNLYLVQGKKINIAGDIQDSAIGVTLADNYSGVFTSGYGAATHTGTPTFTYDLSSTKGGATKIIGENTDSEYAVVFTVELMHKVSSASEYTSYKTYADIIYGNTFTISASDDPYNGTTGGGCNTTMWYKKAYVSGETNENLAFTKDNGGDYLSPAITQNYTLYSYLRTEHQGSKIDEKAPTCTEPGCHECWKCSACGNYFTDNTWTTHFSGDPVIPATGHNDMGQIYSKPATCEEVGFIVSCYRCNNCDKLFSDSEAVHELSLESVVIPKLAHNYTHHAEVKDCFTDGNKEYIVCSTGNEYYRMATAEDTTGVVTIAVDGTTYNCVKVGNSASGIPAELVLTAKGDHTLEHVDELPFTCEENGHKAYDRCTVCGKYFADDEEVTGETDSASGLPADLVTKAHHIIVTVGRVEPTCLDDGCEEYAECTECGKTFISATDLTEIDVELLAIPTTGEHTISLVEAEDATCEDDGNKAYYICDVCGLTFSDLSGTEEIGEEDYLIPALGHKFDKMYVDASDLESFGVIDIENTSIYLSCTNPDCYYGGLGGMLVTVSEITYISGDCLHGNDEYVTVKGTVDEMEGEEYTLQAIVTVNKIAYDMSGVTFPPSTVSANRKTHSLEVSGTLPEGVTVTYEGNGQKEAGTYTVTAKFAGDYDNYIEIPDMTATLTITPSAGLGSVFDTSSHLFYIVITAVATAVVMLLLFLLLSLIMSKRRKKKTLEREAEFRRELGLDRGKRDEEYDEYDDSYDDRNDQGGGRDDYDDRGGYDRGYDSYDDRGGRGYSGRDDYDDRGGRGYDDRGGYNDGYGSYGNDNGGYGGNDDKY